MTPFSFPRENNLTPTLKTSRERGRRRCFSPGLPSPAGHEADRPPKTQRPGGMVKVGGPTSPEAPCHSLARVEGSETRKSGPGFAGTQ